MIFTYNLQKGQEYQIREARPEDASKLINFLNSIAGESDNLTFGPGELKLNVEDEIQYIEGVTKAGNQFFIIAELEEQIIGDLSFTAGTKPRIAHVGEFGVSVLKQYWGNGIASNLIHHLIKWAEAGGKITKINLQVREDNQRAIRLYKKFGFEIEGLIKRTFLINGKYYNSYQMGKIIENN